MEEKRAVVREVTDTRVVRRVVSKPRRPKVVVKPSQTHTLLSLLQSTTIAQQRVLESSVPDTTCTKCVFGRALNSSLNTLKHAATARLLSQACYRMHPDVEEEAVAIASDEKIAEPSTTMTLHSSIVRLLVDLEFIAHVFLSLVQVDYKAPGECIASLRTLHTLASHDECTVRVSRLHFPFRVWLTHYTISLFDYALIWLEEDYEHRTTDLSQCLVQALVHHHALLALYTDECAVRFASDASDTIGAPLAWFRAAGQASVVLLYEMTCVRDKYHAVLNPIDWTLGTLEPVDSKDAGWKLPGFCRAVADGLFVEGRRLEERLVVVPSAVSLTHQISWKRHAKRLSDELLCVGACAPTPTFLTTETDVPVEAADVEYIDLCEKHAPLSAEDHVTISIGEALLEGEEDYDDEAASAHIPDEKRIRASVRAFCVSMASESGKWNSDGTVNGLFSVFNAPSSLAHSNDIDERCVECGKEPIEYDPSRQAMSAMFMRVVHRIWLYHLCFYRHLARFFYQRNAYQKAYVCVTRAMRMTLELLLLYDDDDSTTTQFNVASLTELVCHLWEMHQYDLPMIERRLTELGIAAVDHVSNASLLRFSDEAEEEEDSALESVPKLRFETESDAAAHFLPLRLFMTLP